MAFSILKYPFLDIFTFWYYANKQNETRNREHLQNFAAVISNQKCTSQEEQIDSFCVVAMAILLALVPCVEKPNMPVCDPGQRALIAQNENGSHIG